MKKNKERGLKTKTKTKPNVKVIIYSTLALISLYLAYTENWLFIIISVILMILNQRELMRKK